LEGSIVSLEKQPMSILKLFCDNLKKDNTFLKNILSFEIGPTKTRKIFNFEVLDFIIEAKLK
ncbi:MAG: hypothetical protein NC909_00585, partial [Candidatus Omnitrophica bacterium]|nr:hypothetical protein [Candidatus Omnitrophota bacterium]